MRRCGLGSGGCGDGSRFDPPDNVRPLQRALWLKELADFPQGMHDHVDDNGAEERSFELLSFLELFGAAGSPFPAREADGRQVMAARVQPSRRCETLAAAGTSASRSGRGTNENRRDRLPILVSRSTTVGFVSCGL